MPFSFKTSCAMGAMIAAMASVSAFAQADQPVPQDGAPLIVMGDFNATQDDSGLATLTGARFFSTLPRNSVATTLNPAKGHPNRVIDHIFAEREFFDPVEAHVFGDVATGGEYPSDHFGVTATLRLI